jgi:hypothetical protein
MGEAVQHWPRRLDAVASNDAHARELAAMMGFSDVRLCGALVDGGDEPAYSEKLQRRKARRARLAAA